MAFRLLWRGVPSRIVILSVGLLLLFLGCGGGGDDDDSGGGESAPPPITITLGLPDSLDLASLDITAGGVPITADGDGTLTLQQTDSAPVLAVALKGVDPVAISLVDPARSDNAFSCLETAVSLILLKTDLLAMPDTLLVELAGLIRAESSVQALGSLICEELSQRDAALVEPSEAMTAGLAEALDDVMEHVVRGEGA